MFDPMFDWAFDPPVARFDLEEEVDQARCDKLEAESDEEYEEAAERHAVLRKALQLVAKHYGVKACC